ncbi:MAG TPA: hypothetical protein VJJ79_01345 [Candidatus Nanoarchaeia archaeon]|nr:hypothetical protein [Candidatus Nanoarchaeia archaeon]
MQDDDLAEEELKRIDHLIFVTLKYTRTVDIIKTILQKFILTIDYKIEQFYNVQYNIEKIKDIPLVPMVRLKNLERLHPHDKKIKDMVDFYMTLKKICNAEQRAKEEYRKNVTLVTKEQEVNIPKLKEYVEKTKEYVQYLDGLMK